MKQFSYQKYYSLCRFSYVCLSFNYVRLSFNYVFLSFNYYISSCLLDIQLCSILSFNYYFLKRTLPHYCSCTVVFSQLPQSRCKVMLIFKKTSSKLLTFSFQCVGSFILSHGSVLRASLLYF